MQLSDCKSGQICQITHLLGLVDMKIRLVNLGFHTRSIIELIAVRGNNLIVIVDGSRFALDKQIAKQVVVEPIR